ncbi:MAG: glycosyltransferase family 39 protein [Chitinophagales bacterium]|nr:glycosyltransferase family 39 protein [Chitinophagales bacterium]
MTKQDSIQRLILPISIIWWLLWLVISCKNPFFWDTVLTSKIAQFYFDNGLSHIIVPLDMDAGHPPFFQVYLCAIWKIFGKSLATAHLSMLPFILLMVISFYKICKYFFTDIRQVGIAMTLFCLEPTILAQSTLVSYDIVLLSLSLFGLYAILYEKRDWLYWINILLLLTCVRAFIAVTALFCIDIFILWNKKTFSWFRLLKPYFVGGVFCCIWHLYHFQQTGWMIFSPSPTWDGQRDMGNWNVYFRNIAVIIRNILDCGRIGLGIITGIILLNFLFNKISIKNYHSKIYIILIIVLVTHVLFLIPFTNPIGHRYLIWVYAIWILWISDILWSIKHHRWLLALMMTGMILGHFVIYPDKISKGWDSSLAYLPYFKLKENMDKYMHQSTAEVATKFPMIASLLETNLKDGDSGNIHFSEFNINNPQKKYILYSNISNDFQEFEYDYIKQNFTLIHTEQKGKIRLELYEWKK